MYLRHGGRHVMQRSMSENVKHLSDSKSTPIRHLMPSEEPDYV